MNRIMATDEVPGSGVRLPLPLSDRGFTFVEVVVSMAVTLIVMAAVFGLLARGFRTAPAEFERSDLQAQARHALEQVSRDVLHAGTGLPPEFPAFTPSSVNPELDPAGDAIEMVGYFDRSAFGGEPVRVLSFDGRRAVTEVVPGDLEPGDLVLIYNDAPTDSSWLFGLVASVSSGPPAEVVVRTEPGASEGVTSLPPFIDNYNRPRPTEGYLTPVSVVSYQLGENSGGASPVLTRRLNWGEPREVAYVEDLQIRYFLGGTASGFAPIDPPNRIWGIDDPPPPRLQLGELEQAPPVDGPGNESDRSQQDNNNNKKGGKKGGKIAKDDNDSTEGVPSPPHPQPDAGAPLDANRMVRGVGISVTSRSNQANLEGSTVRDGESDGDDGYLRVTFGSRVATRNLLNRLALRKHPGSP